MPWEPRPKRSAQKNRKAIFCHVCRVLGSVLLQKDLSSSPAPPQPIALEPGELLASATPQTGGDLPPFLVQRNLNITSENDYVYVLIPQNACIVISMSLKNKNGLFCDLKVVH